VIRLVRSATLAALIVGIGGAMGCAARSGGFSGHFIKEGKPSVSIEAEKPQAVENSVRDYIQKVRELQAKAHPKSNLLPTLESTNPLLAKALLALAMDENPQRHIVVAEAYRRAGITDYAFRHYQRALTLAPCSAAAYDGMARLWRDWGRPDIALGDSYRAVYCSQQSPEVYNTLGTIMTALGQSANARNAYRHALDLDPRNAPALTNLGYMELRAGHLNEAVKLCADAVAAAPAFEPARNNLALAYVSRGDYQSALLVLQDSQNAVAKYNLGVLRLANGDFRLAAEAFDAAAELQPSMRIARARAVQARRAAEAGEGVNGTRDQR